MFVLLVFLSFYSYLIYPLLLRCILPFLGKPWQQKAAEPRVSMVVCAYNEESVIREKLNNALNLDYPDGFLEIIMCSDGSTDGTNQIVSSIADHRITFHAFAQRSGKTACLNRAVPNAKGEIILFTDANSILPGDVLKKIVRNFSDPEVGLVTGWTKYQNANGQEVSTGSYARYEKALKIWESAVQSCVGADGAIFAIRKDLYCPLRDDDINDFVIPLDVIRQNRRVVLDPEVFCFEEGSESAESEYSRQVRITTRTLWAIRRNMGLLNPFRYGLFAIFLFSHKLMRFLTPFFLIATYLLNLLILRKHPIYRLFFLGYNVFLTVAAAGFFIKPKSRIIEAPAMLLVSFVAQGKGFVRMLQGIGDTTWTPRK
jgi:cellulose synthase/poly-beta-1,6-N-acetylglucosamine synthase-like glycosyltransferase